MPCASAFVDPKAIVNVRTNSVMVEAPCLKVCVVVNNSLAIQNRFHDEFAEEELFVAWLTDLTAKCFKPN